MSPETSSEPDGQSFAGVTFVGKKEEDRIKSSEQKDAKDLYRREGGEEEKGRKWVSISDERYNNK